VKVQRARRIGRGERVSALGRSLGSLLFELREVELRLDALQTAVATELEDRQATPRR